MLNQTGFIIPDWPAPKNVRALVSTRSSLEQLRSTSTTLTGYDHFNLALHVNDDPQNVLRNRAQLAQHLAIQPNNIIWLEQVHGIDVLKIERNLINDSNIPIKADASISSVPSKVCTIMTADCLPVLFCNIPDQNNPQQIAAAHAGWRGLAKGILSNTLAQFSEPHNVIAWLGPAISQKNFEVGQEVYDTFISKNPANSTAFIPSLNSSTECPKWLASLTELAKIELSDAGVKAIYGGDWCTFKQEELFYSYRRDGAQSGRMASLIMLT